MNYWILWEDSNNVRLSAKKHEVPANHFDGASYFNYY